MSDYLDNPVWHALVGPHARFALGRGQAWHYPRDMAPFSAIANDTDAAYADLASHLPPDVEVDLFRLSYEPLPSGWTKIDAFPMLQMIMARLPVDTCIGPAPVKLTCNDIPAMMDLVRITSRVRFPPHDQAWGVCWHL